MAVEPDEIGRIYSVLQLVSAISGSFTGAAYQLLYNQTLDTLPGTFLIVASVMTVLPIPVNVVMKNMLQSFIISNDIEMSTKL